MGKTCKAPESVPGLPDRILNEMAEPIQVIAENLSLINTPGGGEPVHHLQFSRIEEPTELKSSVISNR